MIKEIIRRGVVQLLSASLVGQAIGFAVLLLLPLLISPGDLGLIKILQSYMAVLLILAGFGYNNSVLKLSAELDRSDADREGLLSHALKKTLLSSIIAYFVLVGILVLDVLPAQYNIPFLIFGLSLPLTAAVIVIGSHLQAGREIPRLARLELTSKALWAVGVLIGTALFGLIGFVWASVVVQLSVLLLYLRVRRPKITRGLEFKLPISFHRIASFSFLSNVVHTLGRYGDIFLLSIFLLDPLEIGRYALAHLLVGGASMVVSNIQRVVLPLLSERSTDGKWFVDKVRRAQQETAIVSVIVAVLVFFVGFFLIKFVYSADYSASIIYLAILLYAFVIRSCYSILGVSTMSLGRPVYNFFAACISTPTALLISIVMLNQYGVVGLAWAQVFSAFATLLILWGTTREAYSREFGRAILQRSASAA